MRTGLLLLLSVLLNLPLWAHKGKAQVSHKNVAPVVVVSSYNPDVKSISDNLSAFYEQYTKSGLPNPIAVEDINAQNLPDGKRWRIRLKRVLNKYYSRGNRPACIVLLGMEASSAYFSFDDDEKLRQTPVVVGMRSSAIVKMPQDSIDFKEWDPVAYDVTTDFKHFNIVGGEVYHYDMKKNFDFNRLQELHLSLDDINVKYEMVNMPISIFKEYFKTIIIVLLLFIVLLSALIVSLYLLKRGKKLRLELLRQGKELLVAKYNAEQANLMKSRFIANMSHEIRTPLNAVMGFSQILTNDQIELTAEEKQQYGEMIMVNGELLLKLIDDVLDISKIDAGKMRFNKGEYDVVSLINTAAQSALANKKPGVDIIVETRVEHLQIATDRERLLQVLANLLNNAKKCTDSGKITISLDQYPEQRMIKISVSDTGCGIPVEKAEEVFERFKKLDAFRQGTGLGLAICKLIVEELGGKIWVDTDYTDGARFVFTHPM